MAQSIEHRAEYDAPAETVRGVLVDPDYLRARLAELGGKDAELVSHEVTPDGARLVLRQGVPVEFLPTVVRRFTGDDLVLDRTERWNGLHADIEVTVRGLPGSITGSQDLTDDGPGSRLALRGETRVPVPMVGGRIEGVVAEQVTELMGFESEFTRRWLAEHA